jgi:uncharacterized membrane protein
MINKIKNYVEGMFEDKPKSKKINDLKDELIANLIEKYNDLLKEKNEDEAYNTVIASIGDIDELISELEDTNMDNKYTQEYQNKKAKYIAIAVMLYIISVVPVIYFSEAWGNDLLGVIMMFAMIAIATGLIVYVCASKPKYARKNDTLVEEFKEWESKKNTQKRLMSAILSAFWLSILALYFILSFIFDIWSFSWIIFIVAASLHQVIKAIFELRGE